MSHVPNEETYDAKRNCAAQNSNNPRYEAPEIKRLRGLRSWSRRSRSNGRRSSRGNRGGCDRNWRRSRGVDGRGWGNHRRSLGRGVRCFRLELCRNIRERNPILIAQSRFVNPLPVNHRPIGRVQVLQVKLAAVPSDPSVGQRNGSVIQDDSVSLHAAQGNGVVPKDVGNGLQTGKLNRQSGHELTGFWYSLTLSERFAGAIKFGVNRRVELTGFCGAASASWLAKHDDNVGTIRNDSGFGGDCYGLHTSEIESHSTRSRKTGNGGTRR